MAQPRRQLTPHQKRTGLYGQLCAFLQHADKNRGKCPCAEDVNWFEHVDHTVANCPIVQRILWGVENGGAIAPATSPEPVPHRDDYFTVAEALADLSSSPPPPPPPPRRKRVPRGRWLGVDLDRIVNEPRAREPVKRYEPARPEPKRRYHRRRAPGTAQIRTISRGSTLYVYMN
jgi:hypothetical protein